MQAAAGRARRLLTSPAASGILSAPRPGCAALAGSGALLPRLDGVPSSPSPSPAPPLLARSFSATSSSRLPRNLLSPSISSQWRNEKSVCYHMAATHYSTEASDIDQPTEAVVELYQKMLKSVEAETMPPNAWLWSMISSCSNKEDIKLLIQILQKLRRLSNLRIDANFNDHLCMKVAEACARVGALDYGLKVLWKHNVYGITPTIGSAHYLLKHAKEKNDTKLMGSIMQVLQRNSMPLQPGTADIVFSICYNADRWDLLSKYARRFVKSGVKLHGASFDIWMDFAAKVGDSQSIWNINSLRGKSVKRYNLATGFACVKGFLLERKPESAAAMIKLLHKHSPDEKKQLVTDELQKLVAEWPAEVIKRQKKDDRKALEEALITDIPQMISSVSKLRLDISSGALLQSRRRRRRPDQRRKDSPPVTGNFRMRRIRGFVFVVILVMISSLCSATNALSWSMFSSSSKKPSMAPPPPLDGGVPVAEFSIDGGGDARGDKLMENARRRIAAGDGRPGTTCWSEAYRSLFASCGDIMADKELQARLAWRLSGCFQEDSGRPPLPPCDAAAAHGHGHADMVHCRERLSDSESKVFLAFFLETNTLCHQLQAEAFKRSTERLVNDLTRSARSAREKLEAIEERSEKIMRESDHLRRSLSSIMSQTEHLATASEDVRARIGDVLDRSAAIFERSREIAAAQAELRGGQAAMREELAAGMAQVEASYRSIGEEMGRLKQEAMGIEREVRAVGDAMAARMVDLQSAADDIGAAAGRSLENQMLLLDGQAKAMEGLNHIYSFQAQALQESRETIQKLAQFGQQQQEELLSRQEQIRHAHDDLMKNSESILEAQEEFRAKQASIFAALDKLYVLHNAVLVESRFIKAFFFYCCITFLVYLLTSAKQTFAIRGHLYFGLCITLVLETVVIKLGADDFSKQFLIMSKVLLIRSVFLAAAAAQILHSIFTYKDYEVLNHQLLQTLMEKVRAIEGNGSGGDQMNPWSTGSDCSSIGDCSLFFDEQLQDEVDSEIDPDFALPREICGNGSILPEEFGENSVTTSISRRYNLRPRIRPRFSEDNHIR
uniref:Uncharacterized protein n=1 Tax=Oryza nivara TaxID=4536 RepID=A0A0E0I5E7_ORYNI